MERYEAILAGEVKAASRLIRDLEDGFPEAIETIKKLYPYTGQSHVIGITGSPGVGKSTLCDELIATFRRQGKTVGVLAVDPTSPFSGGAILGDRIRMQRHAEDPGVFIRSLATRGALGGLSQAVGDSIHVLDSMGKQVLLVETVGTGQQEVEIMNHAHTIVVVLVPGMGDAVQAIKAGVMEIADIFVINKADREGAEALCHELNFMLDSVGSPWRPPVIKVGNQMDHQRFVQDIEELGCAIREHRQYLAESGGWEERRRRKAECEIRSALLANILEPIYRRLQEENILQEMVDQVVNRKSDPHTLSQEIARRYLK